MESAQYLYMDIHAMDSFFNWTMTYRRDSDFFRPYGRIVQVGCGDEKIFLQPLFLQVKPHPTGEELDEFIKEFGKKNRHLAEGKNSSAAWFVSHCATQVNISSRLKNLS